jgi:predicted nucleic acid-binding Zn ribbon protein
MNEQGSDGKLHGPKPLSDILADLFAARGLARVQATGELESAWATTIGEPGCRHTRVEHLRRGILSIVVAHPTLLAELASFQKPTLLASMRRNLIGTSIHDIRFRVGTIQPDPSSISTPTPPSPKTSRRRT